MSIEIDDFTLKFLESKNDIPYEEKKHILLEIELDGVEKQILVFHRITIFNNHVVTIYLTPQDNYIYSKKRIEISEHFWDRNLYYYDYDLKSVGGGIAGVRPRREIKKCKISLYVGDYF